MKRILKLSVSLAYFVASVGWNLVSRLLGRRNEPVCAILYYHAVPSKQRQQFARQMDLLLQYTTPVPADMTGSLARGRRYASVTFDDGFLSVMENALPELKKRNIPSTIFVVTRALGQFPSWLTEGYRANKFEKIMSGEQLKNLPTELVTLGSHTMTHPNLLSLSCDEARREIVESRKALESILNRPVRLFSFPYGLFNEELAQMCREAGYQKAFTTVPTLVVSQPSGFLIGRVDASPMDCPLEFRLKLFGAYRWLPWASKLKQNLRFLVSAHGRADVKARQEVKNVAG
jgi:peptidoglycan/xylan/chitin deacetylase (PgdA/CDA1 family)